MILQELAMDSSSTLSCRALLFLVVSLESFFVSKYFQQMP